MISKFICASKWSNMSFALRDVITLVELFYHLKDASDITKRKNLVNLFKDCGLYILAIVMVIEK